MLTPIGILKHGLRAALKRRYGYAALRRMRAALRTALRVHRERSMDPTQPYSISMAEIRAQYFYGMSRLRKRWPTMNYLDPRAEP